MSRHAISSLAAALAILATSALAQNPAGGDAFKKYDTNGDGRITAEELPNRQALQKFDSNGDGVITRDELGGAGRGGAGMAAPGRAAPGGAGQGMGRPGMAAPGMAGGQVEALVKAADKDGDGRITRAEAGGAPWFARLDTNQDGVVDAGELTKVREGMGKGGMGKGQAGGGGPDALIAKADANGDGRITRAEAGDAPWFDKVDRNEDGVLDAGELNVLRDAMEKKGAGR